MTLAQAQPIDTLQPHSVRTLAHLNRPEPPLTQAPATAPRPKDACLGKAASGDAAIFACSTLIEGGERWRHSLGPAYGRRAEVHRSQGAIDAALADFAGAEEGGPLSRSWSRLSRTARRGSRDR